MAGRELVTSCRRRSSSLARCCAAQISVMSTSVLITPPVLPSPSRKGLAQYRMRRISPQLPRMSSCEQVGSMLVMAWRQSASAAVMVSALWPVMPAPAGWPMMSSRPNPQRASKAGLTSM
ncbi:hypothetical protein D3C81_927640 [compost metagenome]